MRVRRGQRGVSGVGGRRPAPGGVEGPVGGPPQQAGALVQEGGVQRAVRVQRTDQVRVRQAVGPVDVQRAGGAAQPLERGGRRGGQGAEQADPGVQHQLGRGHAGEQRDLGVPAVGGGGRAVAEDVAARGLLDLLLGHGEADPAALALLLLAQPADGGEQDELLVGAAGVHGALDGRVVEPAVRADHGAPQVGEDDGAVLVQVELPEQRGAGFAGQQAGRVLGEPGGVQRHRPVGEVEGLHPAAGLLVDGPAGADERGDVGDGVVHPVAAAGAVGEVHRLVEVAGAGRVDGEQRQFGGVVVGQPGCPGGPLGLRQRRLGPFGADLQSGPQLGQFGIDPGGVGGLDAQFSAGHGGSVGPGGWFRPDVGGGRRAGARAGRERGWHAGRARGRAA